MTSCAPRRYCDEIDFDPASLDDEAIELMKMDMMKRDVGMFQAQELVAQKLHRMEMLVKGQMPPSLSDVIATRWVCIDQFCDLAEPLTCRDIMISWRCR